MAQSPSRISILSKNDNPEQLIELYSAGLSYTEMAERLDATKGQVAGLIHRLKLEGRLQERPGRKFSNPPPSKRESRPRAPRASTPPPAPVPAASPPQPALAAASPAPDLAAAPPAPALAAAPPAPVLAATPPAPKLPSRTCAWIDEKAGGHWRGCCEPAPIGSYCEQHAAVVYRQSPYLRLTGAA